MWIILNAVQRLIYRQDTVVMVCQLAQLVRNSWHAVQPNYCAPSHPRGHVELAGHAPLHPEKEHILCVTPVHLSL